MQTARDQPLDRGTDIGLADRLAAASTEIAPGAELLFHAVLDFHGLVIRGAMIDVGDHGGLFP